MKPIEKVSQVEQTMRQLFKRQNTGTLKTERNDSPLHQYPSLSRKNLALFEQQQQDENGPFSPMEFIQKDWQKKTEVSRDRETIHLEVNDLKATINKYEIMVLNLMQKIRSERENHKSSMREINKANEGLRGDISKLSDTLRTLNDKRGVEQRDLEKYREDVEKLTEKNQKLEVDISKLLETIQTSDALLEEAKRKLNDGEFTHEDLEVETLSLQKQVDRIQKELSQLTEAEKMELGAINAKKEHKKGESSSWIVSMSKIAGVFFAIALAVSFYATNSFAATMGHCNECDYDEDMIF